MPVPLFTVAAFTDRPFAGNPAAICLLDEARDEEWYQRVAREMNLSETAFLLPEGDGWRLRWFTPAVEVDLCGHATLASAHVLWEQGILERNTEARFHTRSGLLTARYADGWIRLDFPALPVSPVSDPPGLADALGVEPSFTGGASTKLLTEIESVEELRSLSPDFRLLGGLPCRGVIVTARSAQYDFVSRYFAPQVGIDEDPVTGSAHCALGPYWQQKLGKSDFNAYQASERGGVVRVSVRGDRVLLGGQAVTVLRGELLV